MQTVVHFLFCFIKTLLFLLCFVIYVMHILMKRNGHKNAEYHISLFDTGGFLAKLLPWYLTFVVTNECPVYLHESLV